MFKESALQRLEVSIVKVICFHNLSSTTRGRPLLETNSVLQVISKDVNADIFLITNILSLSQNSVNLNEDKIVQLTQSNLVRMFKVETFDPLVRMET